MSLPRIWFEWLTLILIVSIFYFMLNTGKDTNSIIPVLGLFAASAFRVIPSLTRIMNSVQNIKYSSPAIKPFILEFKEERPYKAERSIKEKIEFNNEIKFSKINLFFQKQINPYLTIFLLR